MPSPSIDYVLVGRLQADYYITPDNEVHLDQIGGSAIYAAVGAAIWSSEVGLVTRIGANYNSNWVTDMAKHGLDTTGIKRLERDADQCNFFAYVDSTEEPVRSNPAMHFTRIGQPLPQALKDYGENRAPDSPEEFGPLAVRPDDIPPTYMNMHALHVAPCDFVTHRTLPAATRSMGIKIITCDPAARYMQPSFKAETRPIVASVDAFLPNEAKVQNYFRAEIDDLWEAAAALGDMGARIVVIKRGAKGQFVYDAETTGRWHVPAYPTKVVDVTGAGDAYCGGFLVGLAETADPIEAAIRGSISASMVIEGREPLYALSAHPQLAAARLSAQRDLVRRV